ncbi:NEW3 domain-containing protein [Thermodesulfobacteriota bacterium]
MRLTKHTLKKRLVLTGLLLCILILLLPTVNAEEVKKELPPRAITVAPEYPSIVVPEGDDVNMDFFVLNGGRQGETITLTITSVPKGWKAWFKTYSFKIGGVYVESDSKKDVSFKAEPEEGTGLGKYVFPIKAQTSDGKLTASAELIINVESKVKEEKKEKGLNISTEYPVLKGPTDGKFEFSIEVENKGDKDAIFNLAYEGPKNWDINFKPSFEDKYFSSQRIKAGQSEIMAVVIKPYILSEPGEFPIKVKVSSDTAKGEVTLTVVLTGTYKMNVGTANGLLSMNAYQGKSTSISFYVENKGSGAQNNISFLTFKPENWKVEFSPEKIDTLPPGELAQVEMMVTPGDQSLVGDYSVGINVEGEKSTKNMEFRVTVRASTAWGWIGIIIIVAVVVGLVFLFIRVGRR